MASKSKIVKDLALRGMFDDIEQRFGKTARSKAEAWRSKKDAKTSANDAKHPKSAPRKHTPVSAPGGSPVTKREAAAAATAHATPAATPPKLSRPKAPSKKPTLPRKSSSIAIKPKPREKAVPAVAAEERRPVSAYLRFAAERRPTLRDEKPGLKLTDITKLIGEEWRALSPDEKAPFEEQYRVAKADWDRKRGKAKHPPKTKSTKHKNRKPPSSSSSSAVVRVVGEVAEHADGSFHNIKTGALVWSAEQDVVPRKVVPMDWSAYEVREGSDVAIVLPALMEFLASFKEQLMEAEKALGLCCSLDLSDGVTTDGILFGTVLAVRPGAALEASRPGPLAESRTGFLAAVNELTIQLAGTNGEGVGDTITLPWLPADHDLVENDAHVITRGAYDRSCVDGDVKAGMQVTRQFPLAEDTSQGELFEGRVYYVGKPATQAGTDFPDTPYQCVHVVWYEQEASSLRWYIKPDQTDNLCSPWDLTLSSEFVHPSNMAAFAHGVPVLGSAEHVLAYISKTEAALPFRGDPAKGDPGYDKVIQKGSSMWLGRMSKKLQAGSYAGSAGLKTMWEDFKLIIHNAKKRNQQAHWEWRAADMLEKELRAVKRAMRPGAGSLHAAKAAIPKVRARPGGGGGTGMKRAASTRGLVLPQPGSKRTVTLTAKSHTGGARRCAATSALVAMASSTAEHLDFDLVGSDDEGAQEATSSAPTPDTPSSSSSSSSSSAAPSQPLSMDGDD